MSNSSTDKVNQKATRTDKRREKTRQLLLSAAMEKLIEKELEDITPEDITELADVGRRTFYNHFDNKKDCVLAAIRQRFVNYAISATSSKERDKIPVISLTKAAIEVFEYITNDPITKKLIPYPRMLADAVEQSQQEFIYRDLAAGFMLGKFKPIIPINVLKPILHWGFVGLIIDTVSNPDTTNSGTDWSRVMLHNLGVDNQEIEEVVSQFQQ